MQRKGWAKVKFDEKMMKKKKKSIKVEKDKVLEELILSCATNSWEETLNVSMGKRRSWKLERRPR